MAHLERYERLLVAFVQAGDAGLKWNDVEAAGGSGWRKHLARLRENGAVISERRGRYATKAGFLRAVMIVPPTEPFPVEEEPEQLSMLEQLPAAPASAIAGVDDLVHRWAA